MMDVLIKQIRTKYPEGAKEERGQSSAAAAVARDRQLGPLRTQSFKRGGQDKEGIGSSIRDQRLPEKKRTQSWLKRQFSKQQMSSEYDASVAGELEYPMAVAAAAFAVRSLEETRIRDEKKGHHGKDISITNVKNKEGDKSQVLEPQARSISFSDEVSKPNMDAKDRKVQITSEIIEKKPEKAGGLVPILKKKLSFAEAIASSPPQNELPEEKTIGPLLPSIKKTPTSTNKSLDRPPSKKPEPSEPKQPQPQPQPADATRKSPTKPGQEEDSSTADSWEKTELHRIKEKFEKLNTTVLEWGDKKKKKAKRKLEKKEAELDKRRAKAMEQYRNELARADSIAGGIRSKAIENRRNEEYKVKEKANKIRLTGEVPATCLCC